MKLLETESEILHGHLFCGIGGMSTIGKLNAALILIETICTESSSAHRRRMGTRVGNALVAARAAIIDPHAICRKWVKRLGGGFHPDTRGKGYTPRLTDAEIAEYETDMEALFAVAADPYECGVMAMADAGLA